MNNALVTGANGALGSSVCTILEEQGWSVIRLDGSHVDLTDTAATLEYVQRLTTTPTALVHTVGGIRPGKPIQDTLEEDFAWHVGVNVTSAFTIIKAVMPLFIQAGRGSIVTVGARDVLHPQPNRSAYAAAKGALVSLTRSIAEEGRPYGIRANVIVPSILRTPANLEWATPEEAALWVTPIEVSKTIAHLLQPDCTISGAVLPMYGKVGF